MFPARAALSGAACLLLLNACAGPDAFGGSRRAVMEWSQARGFKVRDGETPPIYPQFRLLSLLRQRGASATLTVYIEGDGAPWLTPWRPPRDPTPIKPIALALAAADPGPQVAYLGRPCQYPETNQPADCDPAYWMDKRFAPEVLQAMEQALDRLKRRASASELRLVGYSGGGVLAALLATRRDDVRRFVTVAAPLDLAAWARTQGFTPLAGSLDPAALPVAAWREHAAYGVHFVADHDRVVPASVVEAFVYARGGRLEAVAGFDHECCWTRDWPALLRRAD